MPRTYINPRAVCNVDGCHDFVEAKGFCRKHYQRLRTHGDPLTVLGALRRPRRYSPGQAPKVCTKLDCIKPSKTTGLCSAHYHEYLKWGDAGAPQRFDLCPVCRERQYRIALGREMCSRCWKEGVKRASGERVLQRGIWDRSTCLKAGRVWYELTGYAPRRSDWTNVSQYAMPFPSACGTVDELFDSFTAFINELDLPQRPIKRSGGHPPIYGRADCITAGLAFIDNYGIVPSRSQWGRKLMAPSECTVTRNFDGRWTVFKEALSEAIERRERTRPYPGCLRGLRKAT